MIDIRKFEPNLLKVNEKSHKALDPIFGIKSEIETINSGEELFYQKYYAKIGVNTDDDVPLDEQLKLPSLTIIIRCIFQNG